MPYEITATRKRPQGFDELAGQEFVSATLEASLESGRIAHAYLFSGPRGCGKTSTARILAKALNCEKGPTAKPCGVCSSCRSITAGSSLDVIEIDGASNTSVDNVRQIKDEVLFPPNGGKYKVYIIDEVHMLSNSAFNALLKTIEEPPPYIVFIFATTELHKVPATIKSRCQQFAFRLIPLDVVKGLLAKAAAEMGVEVEDEALLWIAKESGGSQRDAYTLFDQVVSFSEGKMTAKLIRDKLGLVGLDGLNALFERAVEGDAPGALSVLDTILERGVSPEQCVVDTVEYVRSLLLLKSGIERESLLGAAPSAYSRVVLDSLTRERIERALAGLLDLHRAIRFSVNPRFEIELAVSRLSRLADYVSPAELAVAVAGLRRYLAGEGPLPCVVDSGLARHGVSGASAGAQASTERPLGAVSSGSTSTQVTRSTQAEQADQGAEKKKPEPPASSRLPPHLMAAFSSLAAATEAEAVGDSGAERKAVENVNPNKAGKAGSGNAGMTFAEQRKPSIQASSAPIAATSVSGIEALPSLAAGTTATGAIAAMSDSAIFVPPRPQAQTPRASIAGIAPPPSRDDDETALEEDEASSSAEDDLWAASPEVEVGAGHRRDCFRRGLRAEGSDIGPRARSRGRRTPRRRGFAGGGLGEGCAIEPLARVRPIRVPPLASRRGTTRHSLRERDAGKCRAGRARGLIARGGRRDRNGCQGGA